jgi:hypothetical protein
MSPTVIECGSGIERVTVYARGAVVTRRVTLPEALPEDAVELGVPGLTALADPGSVRALCDGEREVTALSARLSPPPPEAPRGALVERVRALDLERQRLEAEERSLTELRVALAAARLDPTLPRWARRLDPAARFADATALGDLVDAELGRLDGSLRGLAEALAENRRAAHAAEVAAAQGAPAETEGARRSSLSVRVRLAPGSGRVTALAIEYVVGAARWWPAYTARFTAAATKVSLALDAFVAQASGEDWTRVRLSLSTAHLAHDARLPELRSLRFGRAQPPARRGYRPPPEGLDALFEGYDRAVAQGRVMSFEARVRDHARRAPSPMQQTMTRASVDARAEMEADGFAMPMPKGAPTDSVTRLGGRGGGPPPGFGGAPPPASAPQAAMSMARVAMPARSRSFSPKAEVAMPMEASTGMLMDAEEMEDEGGGGPSGGELSPGIEPADAWLDFDALVLGDAGDGAHRGRLVQGGDALAYAPLEHARSRIEELAGPPLTRDPLSGRGRFDHRYDAAGTADVPSVGRPHRVAVGSAEATAVSRFTAVPREAPEVYREAEIKNPFDAPLLGGPVDVFLDGALATTAELSFVDRAGSMRLGLGVEDRLRVARNARVEESSAGLLGGSLVIDHAVTIDLSSSLGHKVAVEVLERIPVTDEKDLDVKITFTRPDPEKYTQAERGAPLRRGVRFSIGVPPGDKAKIEYGYRVTLPAKNEIVGGNRRE